MRVALKRPLKQQSPCHLLMGWHKLAKKITHINHILSKQFLFLFLEKCLLNAIGDIMILFWVLTVQFQSQEWNNFLWWPPCPMTNAAEKRPGLYQKDDLHAEERTLWVIARGKTVLINKTGQRQRWGGLRDTVTCSWEELWLTTSPSFEWGILWGWGSGISTGRAWAKTRAQHHFRPPCTWCGPASSTHWWFLSLSNLYMTQENLLMSPPSLSVGCLFSWLMAMQGWGPGILKNIEVSFLQAIPL